MAGAACFTGDAVLAESSVFVAPDPGALRGYLAALRRLRAMDLELLCTGHGPPVTDPAALLDRYLAHRADRERRLLAALGDGLRTIDELLDRVWDDAPASLRLAATATLAAHLGKLDEEDRLPGRRAAPAVAARGRAAAGHLSARRQPRGFGEPLARQRHRGVQRRGAARRGVVEDRASVSPIPRTARPRGAGRSQRARARRRC